VIWLLEYMKLLNVLYRGGAGGEFFGGLLTEHPSIATKGLRYNTETERWFLEREDYQSHEPEVTRMNPRDVQKPIWNNSLWNVRLDHGYGFPINPDFWRDYLWNDNNETKTILFLSETRESLDYTQTLAKKKLIKTSDHQSGQDMIDDGLLDVEQFWDRPWESQVHYFDMFMEMIPDDQSVHIVDPYDLLFKDSDSTATELNKITEYLGIHYPINWLNKISSYRTKNNNLINRTIT